MKPRDLLLIGLFLVTGFLVYDRFAAVTELDDLRNSGAEHGAARQPRAAPPVLPQPAAATGMPARSADMRPPVETPAVATDQAGSGSAHSITDRIVYLETVLEQQSEDRGWSGGAALRLEQALSRNAKGAGSLGRIECRSSLCRARYDAGDPAACEALVHDTVHQTAPYFWEGPYIVMRDPPASGKGCGVRMIFGREGADLPTLD